MNSEIKHKNIKKIGFCNCYICAQILITVILNNITKKKVDKMRNKKKYKKINKTY